jgi:hypothetical protein
VDSIEYRLSQRGQWLRRGWIATVVFLIGVAGIAVAPDVSGHATGFLVIPGLVGLIVAIISFNVAHGRTVLSPRGIRTGTFFGHHPCRWPEVADIESVNISVSRYRGRAGRCSRGRAGRPAFGTAAPPFRNFRCPAPS